ncbi:MAG: hypothetical protein ACYCZA_09645 [Thiobacillus sp.]
MPNDAQPCIRAGRAKSGAPLNFTLGFAKTMSSSQPKSNERAIAQQSQEKFEFYLLSLVFTLLALAVQSATFGTNLPKNALELLAWMLFLISGLSGLYRLQWIPVARVSMADKRSLEDEVFKLKELQLQGQTELHVLDSGRRQPIPERINNRQIGIDALEPKIKKIEARVQAAYEIHKYAFVLGLISVACARGYEPALALIQYVRA